MLLQVCPDDQAFGLTPSDEFCKAYAFSHDLPQVSHDHANERRSFGNEHERATRRELARRLAGLKAIEFGGECDLHSLPHGPKYLVPGDTLIGELEARRLGVGSRDDLFGGVVPYAFVASKAITHPLVREDAAAPAGWSQRFAHRVRDSVLDGWTAFTLADAMQAGTWLLERGAVRVKSVRANAGRGQWVVHDAAALQRCLGALDAGELDQHGVVLEQNLQQVETFSVGQVFVGGLVASYHGVQRLTRDNDGESVYGGSTIHVVRGGFDRLLTGVSSDAVALAVERARNYHDAAVDCFPGMILSRINYDIAHGLESAGQWRCGVLEQSWRVGGASGAELAALEYLKKHPQRDAVTAASYEVYGSNEGPPAEATVYFDGHDPKVGKLTKFSLVETNVHS